MPKELWPQKSSALLDIPTNKYGALDGEPGEVVVINANKDGLAFSPAGTGGAAPPNTLTIGTVTEGTEPAAVITGAAPNQTLSLTLPRGTDGGDGLSDAPITGGPYGRQEEAWVQLPGLTSGGYIPESQLPPSVFGQREFIDLWDASTGLPAIPTATADNQGKYYIVSVAGSSPVGGITSWLPGDMIISNGTSWKKQGASTGGVQVVNGKTGATIDLQAVDIPGISTVGMTGQYTDLIGAPKRVYNISATGIFAAGDVVGLIQVDKAMELSTSLSNASLRVQPAQTTNIVGALVHNGTSYPWTIAAGQAIGAFDNIAQTIAMVTGEFFTINIDSTFSVPMSFSLMIKEI